MGFSEVRDGFQVSGEAGLLEVLVDVFLLFLESVQDLLQRVCFELEFGVKVFGVVSLQNSHPLEVSGLHVLAQRASLAVPVSLLSLRLVRVGHLAERSARPTA